MEEKVYVFSPQNISLLLGYNLEYEKYCFCFQIKVEKKENDIPKFCFCERYCNYGF